MARCTIDGCRKAATARGWCTRHWGRWRRWGDPEAGRGLYGLPPEERFWGRVDKREDGCWIFRSADGYRSSQGRTNGTFGFTVQPHESKTGKGQVYGAHRYAWELIKGNPPIGDLEHSCRRRNCVNPDHLIETGGRDMTTRRLERAALHWMTKHRPDELAKLRG